MKNKLFIFSAILLVAVTTITIVSCKKDNEKSNKTENLVNSHELSDMDKEMIAFGEKLKTASNERSGETMPLEEALSTLTNYQNFTMCDASHYSTEMLTDTFTVTVNVNNGEVLLSELNRVYETTKPEILAKMNSMDGDQKAIYLIRTTPSETTRAGLDDYTGDLELHVVTRMLDTFASNDSFCTVFDSTDFWHDFDSLGKCGPYVGQCVGRDCVTELQAMMSNRLTAISCGQGFNTVFIYPENMTIEAINYPDTHSPNHHYALPWRSFWDDPQCVSPDEMNYYLNSLIQILHDIENTTGKIIVDIQFSQKDCYRDLNHNTEFYAVLTLADYICIIDNPIQ